MSNKKLNKLTVAQLAIAKHTECMFAFANPCSFAVSLHHVKNPWHTSVVPPTPSIKERNFPNNCAMVLIPALSKPSAVLAPIPGMSVNESEAEMSVFVHQSLIESVDAEDLFGW